MNYCTNLYIIDVIKMSSANKTYKMVKCNGVIQVSEVLNEKLFINSY